MRKLTVIVAAMAMSCGMAYAGKPLKIYILVGQSNMQGTANISTAKHMAADPKAKALHDKLVGADGKAKTHNDIRIAAFSGGKEATTKSGPLTFGYGKGLTDENVCGPELGFGVTMHEIVKEPILLIKTSWGGKSLYGDFRPPSAGQLYTEEQAKALAERLSNPKKGPKKTVTVEMVRKQTGHYYRLMVKHVNDVLTDPGKYHPAYNEADGYEIAGFVWFQGWNDMVNGGVYKDRYKPGGYDEYTRVLKLFIADVRKEFKAPKMPFVIGVLGVGGPTELYTSPRYKGVHQYYRDAMAAPAKDPELKDSVKAVLTENFWPHDVANAETKVRELSKEADAALKENPQKDKAAARKWKEEYINGKMTDEERLALSGKSSQGFHYLGSMKFYSQSGEAFAKAIAECK